MPNAGDFVEQLRDALDDAQDTLVFFELPDVLRVLREGAFWGIYYEHCSYFSETSLRRIFERCDFEVLDSRLEYDDQYIMLVAKPCARTSSTISDPHEELAAAAHYLQH
ncbi:methyltransferase domain-containing protein [Halioglobus japonicus]|uniref:methyltransferase domain-containing protein n=1 Tax=Halioglobus japonicus TaxID=930805 RepID=UPI0035715977